jgi:signal transduction histidine kinase
MQDRLVHVEGSASLGKLATGIASSTGDLLRSIFDLTSSSTDLVEELRGSLNAGPKKGQVDDVLRQLTKNLNRINEQSDTTRGVVDGILQHASSASADVEPVDINELIEQYLNLTLHGAKGEFPALELVVERLYDHRAGSIEAPPSRLGRALMCILRNAVESVAAHAAKSNDDFQPTITVSTQRLDHAVLIRVRDNGPGVPQDLRDRVFEPFFSTSRDKSGLGLSIAQQTIVDELGGTFGLEHFKEQGAGFYITIPFAREVGTEQAGETSE